MNRYPIEDGIPIPPVLRGSGATDTAIQAVKSLAVGQSVILRLSSMSDMSRYARISGKTFTTRRVGLSPDGKKLIRVWRTT